jgi:predicted DNA-binding antitoxin AbrB/MazE fold protein
MALIIEQGEINNGNIVLSKPLSLPEGTKVRIQIEPIDTDDNQSTTADDSEDFTKLPCFGMWADREDMRDSVAWVRKQREKWLERITRTE